MKYASELTRQPPRIADAGPPLGHPALTFAERQFPHPGEPEIVRPVVATRRSVQVEELQGLDWRRAIVVVTGANRFRRS